MGHGYDNYDASDFHILFHNGFWSSFPEVIYFQPEETLRTLLRFDGGWLLMVMPALRRIKPNPHTNKVHLCRFMAPTTTNGLYCCQTLCKWAQLKWGSTDSRNSCIVRNKEFAMTRIFRWVFWMSNIFQSAQKFQWCLSHNWAFFVNKSPTNSSYLVWFVYGSMFRFQL